MSNAHRSSVAEDYNLFTYWTKSRVFLDPPYPDLDQRSGSRILTWTPYQKAKGNNINRLLWRFTGRYYPAFDQCTFYQVWRDNGKEFRHSRSRDKSVYYIFSGKPEKYGGIRVEFDMRMGEMDTLEAIHNRRSIRRYTDDAIPKADLEAIVDAGRLAATGSNRQPWDFVVVTDRPMIERFKVSGAWIEKAGAVIVVVMDPVSRWWVEDGAAAIENMLLASTALGYGACWVEGDALPREALFKTLLDVPTEKRVMALIPIGVAAEIPAPEKKPLEKVLHWERY